MSRHEQIPECRVLLVSEGGSILNEGTVSGITAMEPSDTINFRVSFIISPRLDECKIAVDCEGYQYFETNTFLLDEQIKEPLGMPSIDLGTLTVASE